jgi:hypothetical protein
MPTENTSCGFYVDLEKTDERHLEIVLNANGREEFETIEEMRSAHGIDAALETLLEDHLGNGWEMVPPEDIGALTSAPILSDEVERDQEGGIADVGRVYWYPEYQVCDEIEELRRKHVVVFRGVPPASRDA